MNDRQRGGVSKKPESSRRGQAETRRLRKDARKAERKKPVKAGCWKVKFTRSLRKKVWGYPAAASGGPGGSGHRGRTQRAEKSLAGEAGGGRDQRQASESLPVKEG